MWTIAWSKWTISAFGWGRGARQWIVSCFSQLGPFDAVFVALIGVSISPGIHGIIGPAIAVDEELPGNFSSIVNNWASVPIQIVRVKDWWDKGYFGPVADTQHMGRIGSYLLIPPPGWKWKITDEPQHPWGHGGTTRPEMTVPWIEVSLEGRRYVC